MIAAVAKLAAVRQRMLAVGLLVAVVAIALTVVLLRCGRCTDTTMMGSRMCPIGSPVSARRGSAPEYRKALDAMRAKDGAASSSEALAPDLAVAELRIGSCHDEG